MKFATPYTLLTNQAADGSGAVATLKGQPDSFVFFPKTAGGTVALTVDIEVKSPAGDWHVVETKTYNAAGNQAPFQVLNIPADEMRATVKSLTNGSLSLSVIAGSMAR